MIDRYIVFVTIRYERLTISTMAVAQRITTWSYLTFLVCFYSLNQLSEAGEIRDLLQVCEDGTFGYKCKYICHCKHGDPCDKITGSCYLGCARGYWGPGCQLANSCFYNGQARHYMGMENRTINTNNCQRWDSQQPHRHSYEDKDFPDPRVPMNFCRTTKDSSRPWCYTTNKNRRWENCDVNNCNCPQGRFGHNCGKECHCRNSNDECDSIMGMCQKHGCASGWTGFDCQQDVECPVANLYGWDCSKRCYCKNPRHCDRFTGPTRQCECKEGYFNPPACEPVTRPRILHFGNSKVNPGQLSIFNCTVSAYPTPGERDIRLQTPIGKSTTLIQSLVLEDLAYTRSSLFQVNSVNDDEKYSCVVRATAGEASFTTIANVYERPMLLTPPTVNETLVTGTTIPLKWLPWSRSRGDTGDPPIMWYSVWLRDTTMSSFRMLAVVLEMKCHDSGKCNYTIQSLTPNTDYVLYISVCRQGDTMDGPPGPTIRITTKCDVPSQAPTLVSVVGELQVNNTYPETRLIVIWEEPPENTWNCDNILRYEIFISDGSPKLLFTRQSRDAQTTVISKLKPATKYCVKVKVVNSEGLLSEDSTEKCTTTPSTIPSSPKNLRLVSKSSTSLTFTWQRPGDNRANVTAYTIIYWKGYVRELSTKKGVEWQSADSVVEFTLNGLEPYTSYHIQVQALNSAGPGEYSNILTVVTEESRPGGLMSFRNMSRTPTSIELQWEPPDRPNGEIKYYQLFCEKIELMYPGSPHNGRIVRVQFGLMDHNYTGLEPAHQYQCSINASNSKGPGPSSSVRVWTDTEAPVDPPAPTILGRSDSTVTIELKPSPDNGVSFYRIIVEHLSDKTRAERSIPGDVGSTQADFYTAQQNGERAYIAAQLGRPKAKGPFVVGDNNTYNGFYNAPLNPSSKYNIWLGAYSEADGTVRQSVTKAEHPAVARSAITAAPPTNHVPVIIGVLVVFIVLILVVAMLLFIWRKRHLQSEREKAEMPNFGPTIIPEPDPTPPSTPMETIEREPLLEASTVSETDSEPVYGNIGYTVTPVKVEDLWDYVKSNKSNDNEGFRREYKLIPAGITACCEAAKKIENKAKNRYGNIVAYDHTRVVLRDEGDDIHDDYINANYIDGFNKPQAYIAAQGPTKATLKDIWRMVWQEESKTIIMLTNPTETGKKKCEQYWPDEDDPQTFHGITVEFLSADKLPDFTTRVFLLTRDGEERSVKQFHYTTWPDHGVPKFSSSLLLLRQKIRAHDCLDAGPPIVHCSAGVGRTGTYIAIDVELEHAKTEGIIDVHNFVQLMRTQRINMVQTLDQYVFVYDCLLEALISGDTTMRADEYPDMLSEMCQFDNTIQKTRLEEQFDILRLITTTIERDETTTALRAENIFKNRSKNIIPANRCRPYLMTPAEGSNDYINAVFTNSFTQRDGFLVTQMPLPNTVIDFWRLVYDHGITTIVMLNELDPSDVTCEQYWSLETCGESYGPFIVETTAEIKSDPSITIRDFTVSNTELPHEVPRIIRQFHFHRWTEDAVVPSSKLALFELLDLVDTSQNMIGDKPVLVHCMDGASRSGLFVAISCILERLKFDDEIDVFQTIKLLRLSRTQFVENLEQFRYCHEIVLDHLNSTKTMTTFTS